MLVDKITDIHGNALSAIESLRFRIDHATIHPTQNGIRDIHEILNYMVDCLEGRKTQ